MAGRAGTAAILAKSMIVLAWLVMLTLLGAVGLEIFLRVKWERTGKAAQMKRSRYEELRNSYKPFAIQHINPNYLFFFPFDLAKRAEINNKVCSVDHEGFRGPGPEKAGNMKLAFLLGGSTAFGHFASSDSTTITGYLNQMQQEYFFVNAGVPSWNSTQELYRLVSQISEYQPALIIAYNGVNDIATVVEYYQKGIVYPPGTPESFDRLYALVGDIRAGKLKPSTKPFYERVFPRLTKGMHLHLGLDKKNEAKRYVDVPAKLIERTAEKYIYNLSLMHDLTKLREGRFIGIFQPMLSLHRNVPQQFKKHRDVTIYKDFHQLVFERYKPSFEYHDFSNFFDMYYETVSFFDREGLDDITDKTIFVDEWHLYDYGNKLVAQEILSLLKG